MWLSGTSKVPYHLPENPEGWDLSRHREKQRVLMWNRREVSEGTVTVISTDMLPKRAGCTGVKDGQDEAR